MDREQVISSLRYFSRLNDLAIDWDKVDLDAIVMLDKAREIADVPFIITSNYRSPEHSVAVGGFAVDAHTEDPCTAFDISCKRPDGKWDSLKAFKIVSALLQVGFPRIGFNFKNLHIHVDNSPTLPSPRLWVE